MACPTKLPRGDHTATLIFMHGLGDTGHGWATGLSEVCSSQMNYLKIICPNAPTQSVTLNMGMQMPSWFDIVALSFNAPQDEPGITKSTANVIKIIEEEIKNGIPSNRIVVGGFSQGGAVGLHALMTFDKKLAGCVGLSTFLPLHQKFPEICNKTNKDTKIFLGHGQADPVVNYTIGEMTKSVMQTYYGNLKFHSYKDLGHSSNNKEMKDVLDFLKSVLPKS